jgi:hypothetical protein
MTVVTHRMDMVFGGVRQFMDGATMTQVREFPGVVTSDGRAETKFGTFAFKDPSPWPAGTVLSIYVHFKNGTFRAYSVEEQRADLAESKARIAARNAEVTAVNNANRRLRASNAASSKSNRIKCRFCTWTTNKWGDGSTTAKAFKRLAAHIGSDHPAEDDGMSALAIESAEEFAQRWYWNR